ncbi:MAG: hypothetical protein P4L90_25740 [Rhodopila sp.]|nr:hypothetical protein [Rhodopila sp.]
MPKYAAFDKVTGWVNGWYDTDSWDYRDLPADRVQVTDAEWATRLPGYWKIVDGKLTESEPHVVSSVPVEPSAADTEIAELKLRLAALEAK